MRQQRHKQLLLILACAFSIHSFSQSITGIWRGYFISNTGETYKLEFQVKESSSYSVSGVSYSYLDIRFYGKATMTGTFVKSSKTFRIREIKTVEVKNLSGGGTCIMNYDLQYSRSGKEEFLEGTFLGKPEITGRENPYDWGEGNCGGGKVFLRRVTTSNFYIEPFLRDNIAIKPRSEQEPEQPLVTPRSPRVNNAPKKETEPPVVKKENPKDNTKEEKTNDETVKEVPIPVPPMKKPAVVVPDVLTKRQNELTRSLVIKSPEVSVKIYDNGEIDDDSISVYLDNRLVLSHERLTAKPLLVKLRLDDANPEHEMVLVAENLGRIPPNTSLMIVEAGDQRFEIRITSTEQKNAVVHFTYEPPN